MLLTVDENPNCELDFARVLNERSEPRPLTHVLRIRGEKEVWCPITAWNETGSCGPALARKVDDSSDGTCYLIYGDRWGLRLKDPSCSDPWDLKDAHQWGEPFLLLPASGLDLRFA
jgi:hypothetical protein